MNPPILLDPRPWAFSKSELTAGLRAHTGDPTLLITDIHEQDVPQRRPSLGRIRGLAVTCQAAAGPKSFNLVLKEPQGTTRTGTAGIGRREVLLYRLLAYQIPVRTPQLLAAHPDGEWLVFNMLEEGHDPDQWTADDFCLAVEGMVALHDRFWGLEEDLSMYAWLARPLSADFPIFLRAASTGIRRLIDKVTSNLLTRDPALIKMLTRLVENAQQIVAPLQKLPVTMIHGDYWPGNIFVYPDNTLAVYDWQQVGIGPGILDLFHFVQASKWYFPNLPLSTPEIVSHYRERLALANGQDWDDSEWERLWDYALLWTFLCNWVDLLANIPASVVQARYPQITAIWLEPVKAALARRLPKA